MKQLFKFLLLALIFNFQSSIFNDLSAQTLRDRYNSQIGRVERDGTVRDRYNSQIGKVESDGTVRDRYNSQLGKVERDGTVRDRYNSHIGKAEGVDPRIAAVLFFMNLLNLK